MKAHLGKQSEIDIYDVRTIKITSSNGEEYEINLYSKNGWDIYVNELDD